MKNFSFVSKSDNEQSARSLHYKKDGSVSKAFFQPKLSINPPDDMYEQEADAVADQVMQTPDALSGQHHFFKPSVTAVQKKCAHCGEEDKKAQRKEESNSSFSSGSQVESYISSMNGKGAQLSQNERGFFEPRMGYDLSQVRLHTDSNANASAKSLNAMAYTHGNHIVFGAGQYQPGTTAGKHLMAHELTHTLQQSSHSSGTSGTVQRKLVINPAESIPLPPGAAGPATPLTIAVQGMLNDLCADGQFDVNTKTGNVTLRDPSFCEEWVAPMLPDIKRVNNTDTPAGCACLCSVVNDAQTTTIGFTAGGPGTGPGSVPGAGPGQGGVKTNATVHIDPRFQGQYRINGKWVDVPFYLLFAHELCGHALPKMQGTHVPRGAGPAGGTPPQEQHAVDVERDIAAEHSEPRRPDDYSGDARQKP